MKAKIFLVALIACLPLMASDCINDPFIVAINLETLRGNWRVNTGDGSFNDATTQNIRDLIDDSYRDKVKGFRIYDIVVGVTGPYPTGVVSGAGYFSFDGGPESQLLSFSGQYSAYASGVSLLNPGTLVTYNPVALNAFLTALNDIDNLPTEVRLRGAGTGPAVTQNFFIYMDIYIQADAEVD
jgi:hypothetical protein